MSNNFTGQIASKMAQILTTYSKEEKSIEDKKIITEGISELRANYLKICDSGNSSTWIKDQFLQIKNKMLETYFEINKFEPVENINKEKIVIDHDSKLIEYEYEKDVILIGRHCFCDIVFPPFCDYLSRLHAIVVVLRNINKIFVIDVGSILGIKTTKRTSDKPLKNTKEDSILEFDLNESFVLQFGDRNITFHPKECIICCEKARSQKYNCGHFVACESCSKNLRDCPICRKSISQMIPGIEFVTKFQLDKK